MPINKNHEFEELDGVKCGIVEKNAAAERVSFLQKLLEHNHYTVKIVPSPPPKAAAVAKTEDECAPVDSIAIPTFTIGVTDYTFNPTNAIFGRMLKTPENGLVTQAYWYQKEMSGKDETPYYER